MISSLLSRISRKIRGVDMEHAIYEKMSTVGHDSANQWIRAASAIPGWMFEHEPEALYEMALKGPPGDILEIGTWCGKSATIFAGACVERKDNSSVICCDTYMMDGTADQIAYHKRIHGSEGTFYDFIRNAKRLGYYERIIPLGNYSTRCIPKLSVKLRLAFIDGRHDRLGVIEDAGLVVDSIVPGGYIAFHDANEGYPEVEPAAAEFFKSRPEFEIQPRAGSLLIYRRRA